MLSLVVPVPVLTRALVLAAAGLLSHGPAVPGSDWPRWRGPANDGHLPPAAPVLAAVPAAPPVLWQVPAGEGLSSPVVAGGQVYVFDNQDGRETLRALAAGTGRENWRADIDEPFSDSQGPTGPRNTPLVDEDRVYAVSCRGELQCRRTADGSLIWRANYVRDFQAVFIGERGSAPGASRHGNNGSPLIDGDHLLAPVGGTNGAGLVCFQKKTGEVVWKSTSDQAGYAPPVVATLHGTPQVIAYTASGVVGLRRSDGQELWRVPVRTAFARHVTTPVVVGDHVVVSSHQAGLLGLRIGKDGDAWTAGIAWTSKEAAINFSSPVAVGGWLYGVGAQRHLDCVEIATGRIAWSQPGVFVTPADRAHGGFIAMKDRILVLTDSGEGVLFQADPAAYRELGRAQIAGSNWCNPAYADGVLYLRDGLKKDGRWLAVRLEGDSGKGGSPSTR